MKTIVQCWPGPCPRDRGIVKARRGSNDEQANSWWDRNAWGDRWHPSDQLGSLCASRPHRRQGKRGEFIGGKGGGGRHHLHVQLVLPERVNGARLGCLRFAVNEQRSVSIPALPGRCSLRKQKSKQAGHTRNACAHGNVVGADLESNGLHTCLRSPRRFGEAHWWFGVLRLLAFVALLRQNQHVIHHRRASSGARGG